MHIYDHVKSCHAPTQILLIFMLLQFTLSFSFPLLPPKVATEFDEFKGHHLGLFKTRRAVAKAASANSPPSPVLKPMHNTTGSSTTTFKVLLEWVPAWRDMPLVLQSKRFPPVGEAEAKQAKEDQGDEDGALMLTDWVTIYDGAAPKAEVWRHTRIKM